MDHNQKRLGKQRIDYEAVPTDLAKAHQKTSSADVDYGDISGAFAAASQVVEATYEVPFLAACMEPMNATARLPTASAKFGQAPKTHWVRARWRLRWTGSGGCCLTPTFHGRWFGRRPQHDASIQAARIARDTGVPAKLIWSRGRHPATFTDPAWRQGSEPLWTAMVTFSRGITSITRSMSPPKRL